MSLKMHWMKRGTRVFTRNGPGAIVSCGGSVIGVELDHLWAGEKIVYFESSDEMVVESDFTLVRVINLGSFTPRLIVSAENYLSWEECICAMRGLVSSNETLLALNFKERRFESNRSLMNSEAYQILKTGLSVYEPVAANFYGSLKEVRDAWAKEVDVLVGTTSNMFLCVMLDFENQQILAKALFATTQVISREIYW